MRYRVRSSFQYVKSCGCAVFGPTCIAEHIHQKDCWGPLSCYDTWIAVLLRCVSSEIRSGRAWTSTDHCSIQGREVGKFVVRVRYVVIVRYRDYLQVTLLGSACWAPWGLLPYLLFCSSVLPLLHQRCFSSMTFLLFVRGSSTPNHVFGCRRRLYMHLTCTFHEPSMRIVKVYHHQIYPLQNALSLLSYRQDCHAHFLYHFKSQWNRYFPVHSLHSYSFCWWLGAPPEIPVSKACQSPYPCLFLFWVAVTFHIGL